jgi:hypothetical protein
MWNSIILISLCLANSLQADTALAIEISHSQNSNRTFLLNVDIFNKSDHSIVLPIFEMFNDSVYCLNPTWEIIIKKDGINYYVPSILCHREIKKLRIKRQNEYKFQIPLLFDKISKDAIDFSEGNYDYGEYEIKLKVKFLTSQTDYFSNLIRINYNKLKM